MTSSWNVDQGSQADDFEDSWPSFEDALRAHGFDTSAPDLNAEKPRRSAATATPEAPAAQERGWTTSQDWNAPTATTAGAPGGMHDVEFTGWDDAHGASGATAQADAPLAAASHAAPDQATAGSETSWSSTATSHEAAAEAPVDRWGYVTETPAAPAEEQWWLEPETASTAPAEEASSGWKVEPGGTVGWYPDAAGAAGATGAQDAAAAAGQAPSGQAWNAHVEAWGAQAEAPAGTDADAHAASTDLEWVTDEEDAAAPVAPPTLGDQRPPTPPSSLFDRSGVADAEAADEPATDWADAQPWDTSEHAVGAASVEATATAEAADQPSGDWYEAAAMQATDAPVHGQAVDSDATAEAQATAEAAEEAAESEATSAEAAADDWAGSSTWADDDASSRDGVFGRHASADLTATVPAAAATPAPSKSGRRKGKNQQVPVAAASASNASTLPSGDSDLWQLVSAPASTSAPEVRTSRTFDPVTIFLTVLVAIVIVVLLVGTLVSLSSLFGG